MLQSGRATARSMPGTYRSSSSPGGLLSSTNEHVAGATFASAAGPSGTRRTFHYSHSRSQSFASRVSHRIATRLSVVGLREPPRTGTAMGVTVNTLCNVMGAGVLALPLAAKNASVGLALVLLTYVTLMSAYAVYCLVAACDATGRFSVTEVTAFALFPSRSFDAFCKHTREAEQQQQSGHLGVDSSSSAFNGSLTTLQFRQWKLQHAKDELRRRRWRRCLTVLVESIVFCSNYGTLIIYARVIADSMPPVMVNVFHQLKLEPIALLMSEVFWLAASGVIFFVLSCAKNMEELKWSSLLGFLTILYVVIVVVYRFFTASWSTDPAENSRGFPAVDPAERGTIIWFAFPVSALRTVSTYGVAFGYHFNVPYFYAEIRNRVPQEMMKSVGLAFPIIVASYATTGVFGYLTFGDLVASKKAGGNIVGNYPDKDTLVNVGRLGLFAHFACVFPIVSISARRGLHRLAMTALTWSERSALMRLEVEELEEEEVNWQQPQQQGQPSTTGRCNSPLERRGVGGRGGELYQESTERTPLLPGTPSGGGHGGEVDGFSALAVPLDPAQLDRDVGSPDDTTRLAMVVEAFLLVCTTVLLAGTVSGISLVIDVIGTLFGLFLILIVPGIVGLRIFSMEFLLLQNSDGNRHNNTAHTPSGGGGGITITMEGGAVMVSPYSPSAAGVAVATASAYEDGYGQPVGASGHSGVRYARVKRWLCALSAVTGVAFTIVGTTVFVFDHLPSRHE